mmetsp:Transcript_29136/g.45029  ORF Transcript_29136/g.45029 Transcript_29136/m.45029 type:complete len:88 (-) Transcript_29136:472-735(-)
MKVQLFASTALMLLSAIPGAISAEVSSFSLASSLHAQTGLGFVPLHAHNYNCLASPHLFVLLCPSVLLFVFAAQAPSSQRSSRRHRC